MVTRPWWWGLALAATLGVLLGCGGPEASRASEGPSRESEPELLIFVYDRSSSVLSHELEHAARLTRDRLGRLGHEDRIVAIELLRLSLDEEPRLWSQQVPAREFTDRHVPRDSVTLARFVQDARDYIVRFSDPDGRDDIDGTDILSTLHLVGAELQAYPDRPATLVLFSDMLQANREVNMEGLVRMPSEGWIERRQDVGRLPDLSGLCVFVAGARGDTLSARIVKDFWLEYFAATGAHLEDRNYAYRPVQIPGRPCRGT